MILGILSDLHGNAAGLRTALDRMGPIDELLYLGDAFHQYRFNNETVRLLRDLGPRYVLGNHEQVFLHPAGADARAAAGIDHSLVDWVANQPDQIETRIGGKKLVMAHASPLPPGHQYVWPGSKELDRLAEVDADYVLVGHTHAQLVARVGRVLVINPGSAGEARDPNNGRRLSYAVLDTSTDEVRIDDYLVEESEGDDE